MADNITLETLETVDAAVAQLRETFNLKAEGNRAFARETGKLYWLNWTNAACKKTLPKDHGVELKKIGRRFIAQPIGGENYNPTRTVAYLNTSSFSVSFLVKSGKEGELYPLPQKVIVSRQQSRETLKSLEPFDRGEFLSQGLSMLVREGATDGRLEALQAAAKATEHLDGIQALVVNMEGTLLSILGRRRNWMCDAVIDCVDPEVMHLTRRGALVTGRGGSADVRGETLAEFKLQAFDVPEMDTFEDDDFPF